MLYSICGHINEHGPSNKIEKTRESSSFFAFSSKRIPKVVKMLNDFLFRISFQERNLSNLNHIKKSKGSIEVTSLHYRIKIATIGWWIYIPNSPCKWFTIVFCRGVWISDGSAPRKLPHENLTPSEIDLTTMLLRGCVTVKQSCSITNPFGTHTPSV